MNTSRERMLNTWNRPIARAIVLHEGKMLLFHRINNGHEYYNFPGGAIERGETAEEAASRETLEETSCEVRPLRVLYVHENDHNCPNTYVLCEYLRGELKIGAGTAEEANMADKNSGQMYEPVWCKTSDLPKLRLYPIEVYEFLEEDIKNDFKDCPRIIFTKMADLKSWP